MFISQRSVSVNPGKQPPSFRFSLFSFWLLTENRSDRRELSHFASSWLDVTQRSGFKPRSAPTLTPPHHIPPKKYPKHSQIYSLFPMKTAKKLCELVPANSQNPSSPVSQLIRYLICKEWKHLFNPSACVVCASSSSACTQIVHALPPRLIVLHAPPHSHMRCWVNATWFASIKEEGAGWIVAGLWFMATSV